MPNRREVEVQDYFAYMPENRLCAAWGCTAYSAGYTRILPNAPYPPPRHPDDHHFVWERGRLLQAFQLVLISEGSGVLDYGSPPQRAPIQSGSLFLLYPGVWHRYLPNPETGWVENWLEVRGSAFDDALATGILRTDRPLHRGDEEALRTFATIHRLANIDALGHQPMLSACGLQLLALLCRTPTGVTEGPGRIVQRAKALIAERCAEPLVMEEIARDLGFGYSNFRQLFRRYGGLSPKQYHVAVRMDRARDLLANTALPIKTVAALMGFSSPFHFTAQFMKSAGQAPSLWRQQFRGGSPPT